MPDTRKESIYEYIIWMAESHPSLPYDFQDAGIAGMRDVIHVFREEGPPLLEKRNLAKALMDIVTTFIRLPGREAELRGFLEENPLYTYFPEVAERMRLLIFKDLVDGTEFYFRGLRLATESDFEEEVKLGILVLGLFDHDVGIKVIRTLALHSSFTIYAMEAVRDSRDGNELFFEWLQRTSGFGKLALLRDFVPVSELQKKWIFEKGAQNDVGPNYSAILCLEKPDMEDFYRDLEVGAETFSCLSRLIAYSAESYDFKELKLSLLLARKFMTAQEKYAASFTDLAAIVFLKESMKPYWIEYGKDVEKINGWSSNIENEIRSACDLTLQLPKWRAVVLREMSAPLREAGMIISVLDSLNMIPDFSAFIPLLRREVYHTEIQQFMLVNNPARYLQDVLSFFPPLISESVFRIKTDPPDPEDPDPNITPRYWGNTWLVFLLRALRKAHQYEEALFLRCLSARFSDLRGEAIQALRVCKPAWSDAVLPAFEKALLSEPDAGLVKKMRRLIGASGEGTPKEQRYVDTADISVTPSPFDVPLFTTKIAGTVFRDLLVTEGRVESGDVLYLKREPDNAYDSKAILVTSEDGYVLGYVPKADNDGPASLLDAGEKLYALLISDRVDDKNPGIKIMLSRPPVKNGKIIKIPFGEG